MKEFWGKDVDEFWFERWFKDGIFIFVFLLKFFVF